ncbi:MAG: hypothetical protein FJ014_14820 [Chloroflexi bacterium]|nr:hypothetical protein [Chloroflexota bacterium]
MAPRKRLRRCRRGIRGAQGPRAKRGTNSVCAGHRWDECLCQTPPTEHIRWRSCSGPVSIVADNRAFDKPKLNPSYRHNIDAIPSHHLPASPSPGFNPLHLFPNGSYPLDSHAHTNSSRTNVPTYTFDPDYAVRCGVSLERLLLIRPHSGREALEITASPIAGRGIGVLVFDSVPPTLFTLP